MGSPLVQHLLLIIFRIWRSSWSSCVSREGLCLAVTSLNYRSYVISSYYKNPLWAIILGYRRLSVKSLQVLLLIPFLFGMSLVNMLSYIYLFIKRITDSKRFIILRFNAVSFRRFFRTVSCYLPPVSLIFIFHSIFYLNFCFYLLFISL